LGLPSLLILNFRYKNKQGHRLQLSSGTPQCEETDSGLEPDVQQHPTTFLCCHPLKLRKKKHGFQEPTAVNYLWLSSWCSVSWDSPTVP